MNNIEISVYIPNYNYGEYIANAIQSLYKQYGRITAMNFITDSNFLFTWYSMKYGLTISSEDVEVKEFKEFKEFKDEIIDKLNRDV